MNKPVKSKTVLHLSKPDPAGNIGYSLSFNYSYYEEDISGSFSYSELEFSGPGSLDDYSCGDKYPIDLMIRQALADQKPK